MVMVDMGPIMPVCAVSPGPMRSIAIITINTGATVQAAALISDSHITCGATASSDKGRSSANCKMQHRQATVPVRPTRRCEPSRLTSSPLYTR